MVWEILLSAFPGRFLFFLLHPPERGDNGIEIGKQSIALSSRQACQNALVNAARQRFDRFENPPTFFSEFDRIGARIFTGPAALQQAFL